MYPYYRTGLTVEPGMPGYGFAEYQTPGYGGGGAAMPVSPSGQPGVMQYGGGYVPPGYGGGGAAMPTVQPGLQSQGGGYAPPGYGGGFVSPPGGGGGATAPPGPQPGVRQYGASIITPGGAPVTGPAAPPPGLRSYGGAAIRPGPEAVRAVADVLAKHYGGASLFLDDGGPFGDASLGPGACPPGPWGYPYGPPGPLGFPCGPFGGLSNPNVNAVAALVAAKHSLGIQARCPTKARIEVLGFPPTVVPPGATVTICTQPQVLAKIYRIIIPTDIAFQLMVHEFRIGKWNLFASGDPVPAALFGELTSDIGELNPDTAPVNSQVCITVENTSNAELTFRAGMYVKAIE